MNVKAACAFILLGLCASACALPPLPSTRTPAPGQANASPQPQVMSSQASDETENETLRELIVRLIPLGMFGPADDTRPMVTLNQLPPLFPTELKLPEGARVLGGLSQGQNIARAAMDTPQAPEDAIKMMKDSLLAVGWTAPPQTMPGGFQPAIVIPSAGAFLCKGKDGPGLSISAQTTKTEGATGTEVHLMIDTYANYPGQFTPCNQPPQQSFMPPKMPTLTMPEGVRARGGGGGGGDDSYASYSTLLTDRPVAELRTHFDEQLNRAGWVKQADGEDGSMAWSTWHFDDDKGNPQTGFLFVMAQERDGQPIRSVHLQISVSG